MKQPRGYSCQIIGSALFFIVLGTVFIAAGLFGRAETQQRSWGWQILSLFLGFSAGFLLIEVAVRHSKRHFNEAVARRERALGRPLSLEERERIKETMLSTTPERKDSPGFNFPLMRLVVEILLLTVPAIILLGFLVAVGAFGIGLGVAVLLTVLTRRYLEHF
jgi:hypothetical protein